MLTFPVSPRRILVLLFASLTLGFAGNAVAQTSGAMEVSAGWKLEDAAKVTATGAAVSRAGFDASSWHAAIVPGTVLANLVRDGVYPDPMFGENNRPDVIPESLARTSWWYRTTVRVPASYAHRHVWLNFDGINYSSGIWVNGKQVGSTLGAFRRGHFDVTNVVAPGSIATIAILVAPEPHPGDPIEHTIANGVGKNGGITASDGPTFLATIGWDWIPGIRDRDTGIWQKVTLSSSGPVEVVDPLVTTDLPLPRTDTAEVAVKATLHNVSQTPQSGVLEGSFEGVHFTVPVQIAAESSKTVLLTSAQIDALHIANPRLWWPNGYGPQNMYHLRLVFRSHGVVSDQLTVPFGIRKITYSVPDSPNLTIAVNGVRVFIRGGNWGFDEALKRDTRTRLDAKIHMHALARMNMIRNWVGQSTSEDFYELCDQYGILLWDEFFQPNPSDGPNPDDVDSYLANVRDKILRYRNHPSIALWCARNEGYPPPAIDAGIRNLMTELEPTRLYQPSSTEGRGVHSSGPYYWREPRAFYAYNEAFKTETGSVSIPTLESVHGMMPEKDWETINDDWAEHDLARGAQRGNLYPIELAKRYGPIRNLADFVRKGQLANYEAYRAMYEGRNAKMFAPETGVITWMSNPAQPSFVWQLYHYDLEANSSLYAVQKASEPVHIQWDEDNDHLAVINNLPALLTDAKATATFYTAGGEKLDERSFDVAANGSSVADLGELKSPPTTSPVVVLRLQLISHEGERLSENTYWRGVKNPDELEGLNSMPKASLTAVPEIRSGKLGLTLSNPGPGIALMVHVQLRRLDDNKRVLPAFAAENYITLLPGETRTISIDADPSLLHGTRPLYMIDGWNVTVPRTSFSAGEVRPNLDADPQHTPETGLPMAAPAK
ncbi:Beta-galactosidase/beta-glucuronidase [Bryocella elongata]|uniref:Beta-galactosidase/beta-glucuronidase n=1 Tax=Bryocella elongata TaxID=863522 RepID=A0A1H5TDE6_9BACT|nr:sugar-binding domain-containing protein [Bryocella elongata]SEF60793.1 Beta-galactosidase/beta-glucuronidase [Bryocella elongata]